MTVNIATVGQRGQITLPKEIRNMINIKAGDQLAFIIIGDHIMVQPLTDSILQLRGSIQVDGPQDFEDIRRKVIENLASKAAGDGE